MTNKVTYVEFLSINHTGFNAYINSNIYILMLLKQVAPPVHCFNKINLHI